ncbi:FlgO family outer membrane protein [Pseudoalteromonas mariniglutinosa]|uniref:FlgO family outer membrane protein n=1 Tax=Pseudoalteromonas mariniglutinosa TaxID=206042 RepID=UPI00384DC0EC
MINQQYLLLAVLLSSTLSGCQLLSNQSSQSVVVTPTESTFDINTMMQVVQQNEQIELSDNSQQFQPYNHHKTLVNYVEQMALDLVDTMQQESELGIAVTSFVDLDASLNSSSQLGNQIAESIYHQLQKFGYGVIDFKVRDAIDVNNYGDFVFSRDIEQLTDRRIASHVLTGTLIYRNTGVEVNARVINLASKQVVATSQKIIPHFVLQRETIQNTTAQIN